MSLQHLLPIRKKNLPVTTPETTVLANAPSVPKGNTVSLSNDKRKEITRKPVGGWEKLATTPAGTTVPGRASTKVDEQTHNSVHETIVDYNRSASNTQECHTSGHKDKDPPALSHRELTASPGMSTKLTERGQTVRDNDTKDAEADIVDHILDMDNKYSSFVDYPFLDYMETHRLPPGWDTRKTEAGRVYFVNNLNHTATYDDPRITAQIIAKNKQAAERLGMKHISRPHSCEHCRELVLDFRLSAWKLMSPRPYEGMKVWCSNNLEEARAKGVQCPFFAYLLKGFKSEENSPQNSGLFLRVGGYSLFDYALDKAAPISAEEKGEMRHKKFRYNISFEKYSPFAMRLCGDPSLDGPSLVETLDGPVWTSKVTGPETFAWVKELLEDCLKNHIACGCLNTSPRKQTFVPARLLEVFAEDENHVRLVDMREVQTRNPDTTHRWCCLSYVWGGDQEAKTTREDLESRMCSMALVLLPRTIQDAVMVARGLGIRFLWVDSLCIVQDDEEDKARELVVMAEIYRLAHFTILAASASSVDEGFLHHRGYFFPEGSPPPTKLRCLTRDGKQSSILAFKEPKEREDEVDYRCPIEERAWCFQERRLSTRILYYGNRGLTFFCRLAQVNNGSKFQYSRSFAREEEATKHDLSVFETREWTEIISNYSARQTSFPQTDKLNAISAVAKQESLERNGALFKNRYVAGLWERSLWKELSWYVQGGPASENLRPRPSQYRGPTWSWVAVDSKVEFFDLAHSINWAKKFKPTVELVDPEQPFGPVRSASIEITGDMVAVNWVSMDSSEYEVVTQDGHRFPAYPDISEQFLASSNNKNIQLQALGLLERWGDYRCGVILQQSSKSQYRRVAFFECCRRQSHHEMKDGAKVCGDRFLSFKRRTVTIV